MVCNPRRENFPINDPNASEEQIMWEFKWLNRADIFSVYFCNSESVQPITFYELGRNLAKRTASHCVISVEEGFSRTNDVVIQSKLALGRYHAIVGANPENHASRIVRTFERIIKTTV